MCIVPRRVLVHNSPLLCCQLSQHAAWTRSRSALRWVDAPTTEARPAPPGAKCIGHWRTSGSSSSTVICVFPRDRPVNGRMTVCFDWGVTLPSDARSGSPTALRRSMLARKALRMVCAASSHLRQSVHALMVRHVDRQWLLRIPLLSRVRSSVVLRGRLWQTRTKCNAAWLDARLYRSVQPQQRGGIVAQGVSPGSSYSLAMFSPPHQVAQAAVQPRGRWLPWVPSWALGTCALGDPLPT